MTTRWGHTKRIVADVAAAERFYAALGFTTTNRIVAGSGDERGHQEQTYMSTTGDQRSHQLVLCRFLGYPPPRPVYPGESWICIGVPDVEEACETVVRHGGSVFTAGQDTEHGVRAAVVADVDGHYVELVGPLRGD